MARPKPAGPVGNGPSSTRDGHTEVATRVARPCSVRRGAGGHVLACAAWRLPLGRRGASTGAAAPHLERPPAHPLRARRKPAVLPGTLRHVLGRVPPVGRDDARLPP